MTEDSMIGAAAKPPRQLRVPPALGEGLDAEVARIIDRAQAEGLKLTGEGGLLPGMIQQAVQAASAAEMTDHLGYERHAAEGRESGNSRNGHTAKTVQTTARPVEMSVPRDRDGSFTPVTVPKGTRRLGEFDDMILSLYAKGLTTRDIAEHLHATYGRACRTRRSPTSPTRSTRWQLERKSIAIQSQLINCSASKVAAMIG